jgi:hypothetical protein
MNGVEGAVDTLRNKAGEEILLNIEGTVDSSGQLEEEFAGLHARIAEFDSANFEVGVSLSTGPFVDACNEMLRASKMTQEQA